MTKPVETLPNAAVQRVNAAVLHLGCGQGDSQGGHLPM